MQEVHNSAEGQFYICDEDTIHAVDANRPIGDAPILVPRKVLPLRTTKVQSAKTFFLSLGSQEKIEFIKQLARADRQVLWSSLSSTEKTQSLMSFVVAGVGTRPGWLPASYAAIV